VQLIKGNILSAISVLESITNLKNKPTMVATLVQLYEQLHNIDGAMKIIDEYLNWLESQKEKNEEALVNALKYSAKFKLRHNYYKEAAGIYEKILKINKNDLEAIPGIVIAYSGFDQKQAEKYAGRLPQLAEQKELDVEKLENVASIRTSGKKENAEQTKGKLTKEKLKKKKKKILPKDPSKPLDPERWIPMKQRAAFKRRRKSKQLEKGAQGGVATGRSVQLEKGKTTVDKSEKITPSSPPTESKEIHEPKEDQNKKGQSNTTQSTKKKPKRKRR